jgi:isoleucyl-tRNA synthetase
LKYPADFTLKAAISTGDGSQFSPTSMGNEKRPLHGSVDTGFVVDGSGRKMSKSWVRYSPEEIIEKFGAEILRLWAT